MKLQTLKGFRDFLPESAKESKSDWSIGDLYSRSWKAVKSNKTLWIFGMAAAMFTAGGFNSNFNNIGKLSDFSSSPSPSPYVYPTPSPIPGVSSIDSTIGSPMPFEQTFPYGTSDIAQPFFTGVATSTWVLLGIEALIFLILGIALTIIRNAWVTGALLETADLALKNKETSIVDSSREAMKSIKPLAWLSVVPTLVLFVSVFVTVLVFFGVAKAVSNNSAILILIGIMAVITFLAFLYFSIYLNFSKIWAQRLVVYENMSGYDAIRKGFKLTRRKKWSMVLLGLCNNILGGLIVAIPLLLFIGIILGAVFAITGDHETLGGGLLILGTILIVLGIFGFMFISGLITAFKAVVWTGAYQKIKGKYDE